MKELPYPILTKMKRGSLFTKNSKGLLENHPNVSGTTITNKGNLEPRSGHVLPLTGKPLSFGVIPLFIPEQTSMISSNSSSKAFSLLLYTVDAKPHNQIHPISSSDPDT